MVVAPLMFLTAAEMVSRLRRTGRRAFPMPSDAGGKIGTVYGVYGEAAGVNIRGRFVIDSDFVIRAREVLTAEVGRNPKELLQQIKACRRGRAKMGTATKSATKAIDNHSLLCYHIL